MRELVMPDARTWNNESVCLLLIDSTKNLANLLLHHQADRQQQRSWVKREEVLPGKGQDVVQPRNTAATTE